MRTLYPLIWLLLVFGIKSEDVNIIIKEEEFLSSTTSISIITSTSLPPTSTSTTLPIISNSSTIAVVDNIIDENFIELGLDLKPIISNNLNETESNNESIINSTSSTLIETITSSSIPSISTTTTSLIEPSSSEIPSTSQQLNSTTTTTPETIPLPSPSSAPPPPPIIEPIPIPIQIPIEKPSPPELLSFNEWREKYVPPSDPSSRRVRKLRSKNLDQVTSESTSTSQDSLGEGGNIVSGVEGGHGGRLNSTEGGVQGGGGGGDQDEKREGGNSKDVSGKIIQSDQIDGNLNGGEVNKDNKSLSPIQPLPNVGTGGPLDPLTALKDRSNYALFECSATVHRASKESKGSASILVEKKDRYMLTPCSVDPQFVELELCDEIQIDTVALANFEFFSSMFKHFSIKVSVNYPGRVDEWHDLGTFRARNARGVQVSLSYILNFFLSRRITFLFIQFLTNFASIP